MRLKFLLILFLISIAGFTVYAQAPVITSFTPASGTVGTLVTVNGTNLNSPNAINIGGTPAIVISFTSTRVVAMAMPGATTGSISFTNANGTATSSGNFTVTPTNTMGTQLGSMPGTQLRSANASFMGNKVSISADGNIVATGCTYSGPIMIYSNSNGTWSLNGQLPSAAYTGIALSADGKTLLCGVAGANSGVGSLSVYTLNAGTWALQSSFSGSGATGASALGTSVSLSADGNTAVAGGNADNSNVGAVWVFKRTGSTWAQQGNKLVGSGNTGASSQGSSVSISADGNTIATGGNGDNSGVGAIWVFSQTNNVWSQQGNKLIGSGYTSSARQGISVALSADGNTLAEGGNADANTIQGSSSGACWVFTRNGGIWNQQDGKIGQAVYGANMGTSISISADGTTFIAGAPGGSLTSGSVNVCSRASGTWQILNTNIMLAVATTRPAIGTSVALSADGNTGIIGAPNDRYNNNPGIVMGSAGIIYGGQTPVTTTQAATNISVGKATLNGTVNDNGATTTVTFEYGTDSNLAGATTVSVTTGANPISAGMGTATFSSNLTGVAPGTTYYYRITGVNSIGTTKGNIVTFTTAGNSLDKINTAITASAAYSLRQLKTTYTHAAITAPTAISGFTNSAKPVVRVRRSADGGLLDIGYTANGDLDTVSLKNFAGTGNAYITIWYDQSGNSYDVTQTTFAQQPLLLSAGVVVRSGLKPAIRFSHNSKTVLQNNIPASAMFGSGYIGSVFPVYQASPADIESSVLGYANSNYAQIYDRWQVHDMSGAYLDVGKPMSTIRYIDNSNAGTFKNYSFITAANLKQIYVGGVLKASATTALAPCTQSQFNIGGIPAFTTYFHEGNESEILIYNSTVTDSDRKIVEDNQAAYYSTTTQPIITAFSPNIGYNGTVVTIKGKNFTGTTAVKFGVTAASSFTVTSDSTLTAIVGAGSNGNITVITASGSIESTPFHFGIPLDKLGITAISSAAYSLRQLKTAYAHAAITPPAAVTGFTNSSTPVVRVRRPADNALLDIGYTANGDLDTVALKNFAGNGNAYIATWYDQSGNSYDVTQSAPDLQPYLVTAGAVERSGIKPAIRFVNAAKTVLQNNVPAADMFGSGYIGSAFPVYQSSPSGTQSSVFGYANSNTASILDRWQVHDISGAYFDVGKPMNTVRYIDNTNAGVLKNYSFIADHDLQQIYENGVLKASSGPYTALTPCTQTQFNIGGIPNFTTYYHDGHESEIIIYNSAVSDADRQTVESNQSNYYRTAAQPVIASFSPNAGYTGTVITIKGKNFTGTTAVKFGVTAASSFTVTSDSTLTAIVGAGSNGNITVITASGSIESTPFHFGIPLDKLGITAISSAAYSLRQLKTAYAHAAITPPAAVTGFTNSSTPVVRVRRPADNALLDIGYTANGDLDTIALKNFAGSGNAYIATWYDQSGNSYDVTQSAPDLQPYLVTAGAVERSGIKPAIRFVNAAKNVLQNNVPAADMFGSGYIGSAFPVYQSSPSGTQSSVFGYANSNTASILDRWQVHDISGAYFDVGKPMNTVRYIDNTNAGVLKNYSFIADHDLQQIYENGVLKASSGPYTALTPCTQTQFNIGGIPNFTTYYHDGHESEIIIYNSAVSDADRQTVESNQSNYYLQQSMQTVNTNALAVTVSQPFMATYSNTIGLSFVSSGGQGSTTYKVEKLAANGAGFTNIGTLNGDGTGRFNTNDSNPLNGDNLYKVVATDSKGNTATSETVKLNVLNGGQGIQIYPVPVKNKQIIFNFSKMAAGIYDVVIVSKTGYLLSKQSIRYDGYAGSVSISAPANKPTDVYFITISSSAYKRTEKVVIE